MGGSTSCLLFSLTTTTTRECFLKFIPVLRSVTEISGRDQSDDVLMLYLDSLWHRGSSF